MQDQYHTDWKMVIDEILENVKDRLTACESNVVEYIRQNVKEHQNFCHTSNDIGEYKQDHGKPQPERLIA